VVTAVEAERAAIVGAAPAIECVAVGVGQAQAASGTARALALRGYGQVLSVGIGGGFAGRIGTGGLALGTRSVAADLGADSPDGFIPLPDLGFGTDSVAADPSFLASLREVLPEAILGTIVTVNTVTGTADRAAVLASRFPDAVAEAMEGYGVAVAAARAGVPFAELRTISNPVGPRDRAAWNITAALSALGDAMGKLTV
jgi:futalosine hydrolase